MLLKRHGGCARVAPASRDARTTMTRLPHATHALHWLNSNDPDAVSCLVSFYTAHVQSVALCLTIYVFECLERGDSRHGMHDMGSNAFGWLKKQTIFCPCIRYGDYFFCKILFAFMRTAKKKKGLTSAHWRRQQILLFKQENTCI
jgi:hypothetical protein